MAIVLTCVYGLGMFFFSIAFLVDWIKSRKSIRKYWKYGLWAGLIVVGLDLFVVAITPSAWHPETLINMLIEPFVFIRLIGFTMLGMYYAAGSGYPSFPILLRKFRVSAAEKTELPQTPDDTNVVLAPVVDNIQSIEPGPYDPSAQAVPSSVAPDTAVAQPIVDVALDIQWKKYFLTVFGASAIMIVYTIILFLLTNPQLSQLVRERMGKVSESVVTIQSLLLVLEVAIGEEIFFRLGIQSFLVKYLKLRGNGYWFAILITATLWTLGHAGTLDPEWVKLVQIFPCGILLGWLFKKYGVESTILVHGVFNVVSSFLAIYLIK